MRIFLIAFLCLLALPARAETGQPGLTPVYTSNVAGAERKVSVLFLGNSYTYFNDMPKMLADIASGDPGNKIQFEVQALTKAGATLASLLEDDRAERALSSRKWDYVVLQEQSLWAVLPEKVEETAEAARKWAKLIDAKEAQPVLFETWARQPNSFWYTDRKYSFLVSWPNMKQKLSDNTAALAAELNAPMAPVGEAWNAAMKENPKWPIYGADSHHPTVAGSYLTALVFYQLFSGRSAEEVTYVPAAVDREGAPALRKFAASVKRQ